MQTAGYSAKEEKLNYLTHGLGALLAVFGLCLMLFKAQQTLGYVSAAIYGGTLLLMFIASTLYHASGQSRYKAKLKLFDHSAIYLLIAGTYTPFLLLSLTGYWQLIGIIGIWALALFGVSFKLFARHKYPRISLATYLIMGWVALLLIYPLYQALPAASLGLLALGGVLFSIGTLFYKAKHRHYSHAIWHVFVLVACGCHFAAIYGYVI